MCARACKQSCSFFNSNAVPLRLALVNADPLGEEINVMFKVGGSLGKTPQNLPDRLCVWIEQVY